MPLIRFVPHPLPRYVSIEATGTRLSGRRAGRVRWVAGGVGAGAEGAGGAHACPGGALARARLPHLRAPLPRRHGRLQVRAQRLRPKHLRQCTG
eukprot:6999240-Pyramimonas_sp.AAC.1